MYFNIFICVFIIIYLSTARSELRTEWVTQKLDNFDESPNSIRWYNRYYVNEEYAVTNGPMFIFVNSGSDAIDLKWLTEGLMHDSAKLNDAVLLSLEPRFYGESRPTQNLSVENLQYLTHHQILYDLANFIRHFKSNPEYIESKVVLWGNSFGATYAVWMKKVFPTLIDGVWASNAILQSEFPGYDDYYSEFGKTLQQIGGSECVKELQSTWIEIDDQITNHTTQEIEREFLLCFSIDTHNPFDYGLFVRFLIDSIDNVLRHSNYTIIKAFCETITATSSSSKIAVLAAWLHSQIQTRNCIQVSYQQTFPNLRSVSWHSNTAQPLGLRQWYWQLCSEFATFRTTESTYIYQPFPNRLPASLFHGVCNRIFNHYFTPQRILEGSNRVNNQFGGLNPNVTNVYFTNSELNSFRFLSYSGSDVYPEGQLNDLRAMDERDSDILEVIKFHLYNLIAKWIGRL